MTPTRSIGRIGFVALGLVALACSEGNLGPGANGGHGGAGGSSAGGSSAGGTSAGAMTWPAASFQTYWYNSPPTSDVWNEKQAVPSALLTRMTLLPLLPTKSPSVVTRTPIA